MSTLAIVIGWILSTNQTQDPTTSSINSGLLTLMRGFIYIGWLCVSVWALTPCYSL